MRLVYGEYCSWFYTLCVLYKFKRGIATPIIFIFNLYRNVPYFYDTFGVKKINPCYSTKCNSRCTMVVSGFGPYHHLVHADAQTERAGVIPTPWVMQLTLGFGAILQEGEYHVPPPPPRKCLFSKACLVIK